MIEDGESKHTCSYAKEHISDEAGMSVMVIATH